jgi:nucleoside-diphosphate-sugar epimerase
MTVLVAGAGGFIGGHLVKRLLDEGHAVRAVDIKTLGDWWQWHDGATCVPNCDLRLYGNCCHAMRDVTHVFNLAADMGGIGFIETHKADCMTSVLINTNLLRAAAGKVDRYFYASSACVYRADAQDRQDLLPLRERVDVYPAMPEDGYGWEKLFSERMCRHFLEDYGLETRVARLHNVYGPHGSWNDGREKAPAATCRKVAEAVGSGNHQIEIWGDGTFTRSFMFVEDCVEGMLRIMSSDVREPLNLGSTESVTVNQLVDKVEAIGGVELKRTYDTSKPKGVAGRNSDNTLILQRLGWEPSIKLADGLCTTYDWIAKQLGNGNR